MVLTGRAKVKAGDKLRFSIPLPRDQEELRQLLTPTKEIIREALLERAAETGQHTVGGRGDGEQNEREGAFQGVGPAGSEHTFVTTAK